MEVATRQAAAVFLFFTVTTVFAQDRCDYMTEIPRPPTPELPDEDFEGIPWSQRPLIPAPRREDLCMGEYFSGTSTSGTQIIFMEEEIEGNITIAKLNYQGPLIPYIALPMLSGSFSFLGPTISNSTGEWHLVITQRQDFETPGMQVYMFNIRVDDETLVAGVTLRIVNIDDNPPIIHLLSTCRVPELGEPRLTECIYNVGDADGEISTRFMQFSVDSDRGDENIFYMQGELIPGDWFRMNMIVGINKSLDFETNALHIFNVTALDSLPNTHTVTMMVQVENVEHRPPRWVEIFAVQQFDEKTAQSFTVRAIDGDTGINKAINYTLVREESDVFFSLVEGTIEGGGAILHVAPIDRDALKQEVFHLSIIAYKYDNASFNTVAHIVIIVDDINDQRPVPLHKEYWIEIPEETPLTLNFAQDFGFYDRDLGDNARYTVELLDVNPPGAASAFYIAPEVGYQQQTFIMGTLNHGMLDYEVPEFQNITIQVLAIDMNNSSHTGVATVYINLLNWNDELPIFENTTYTASFNETIGAGFYVGTVVAHDRDIDDRVVHTLMGNVGDYLTIDQDTGEIFVKIDDAFDYHRQNVLFVQVRADDTLGEPYNTATSQLVIELGDVNNTPPTLRLPRGTPSVEENVPEGYQITDAVTATDPDTTAHLVFEIDWNATWATKQGRVTPPIEYLNCVEIETQYPVEGQQGSAIGRVVVKEIRYNVTIDFEEFEVLYLAIRVRDLNTELGDDYDEATFTINIIDMNDNPPIFASGTSQQSFRVQEMAAANTIIGSVLATDIDGPLYNQVRYTIVPRNNTPDDLVKIDFVSGQLTVDDNEAIDADVPPRHYLYYTVIASDKCYADDESECPPDKNYFDIPEEIAIQIIDTNNKVPVAETALYNTTVYIWENATSGDEIVQLVSSDLDRDDIYHTVRYQINYAVSPRLRVFFEVDLDSGLVYVNYTTNEVLDRDGDEPTHTIFLTFIDNFFTDGDGRRNPIEVQVEVILLDVNDNAPELPTPDELSWSISENLIAGQRLSPDIYAPDRDEPDTDNSRVGYAILGLVVTDRDIEVPDLFTMIQIQNVTGELETAMDLRGYWGTYAIHILAFDHGHPQQMSNETYSLVIRPYNFHHPEFRFPVRGTTVRLARERATANGLLATTDGEFLERIHATDEDGLQAGLVTFSVVGNAEAVEFFDVINDGENYGSLLLLQLFPEQIRQFQITIRATDGGTEPGPLWTDATLTVVFVPTQGDPVFDDPTATAAFVEGEGGMLESNQLPLAEDPKNHLCEDDCLNIYYRILEGNNEEYFALDPVSNVLTLVRELSRENSTRHTLVVAASNSPSATGTPLQASMLTVTITVREANPRPRFVRDLYTAGISTQDSINRELLTVQATHTEGDVIAYTINSTSMVLDPSLEAVRYAAFELHRTTGVLTLTMQPTAAMQGMFEFNVIATDSENETDTAQVKVYVISSLNRVIFIFVNTLQQIEDERDFIATTFSVGFNMTCNIDQVLPNTDDNGLAVDDLTEVRAHFIRDDTIVSAEEIQELRSDTVLLLNIQTTLNTKLLVLQDFVTGVGGGGSGDGNLTAIYVLAALSGLLAFLCLVLLLVFVCRTRALNRRLQALSMTKYGSVDSGLNRAGLAPGTNKHAVEGSNPIWNEAIKAPDFDAISDSSGDSDLIGIEDMPQFRDDYFPPGDSDSIDGIMNQQENMEPIATHSNNFGFNTSPFSPEFTNKQFKR